MTTLYGDSNSNLYSNVSTSASFTTQSSTVSTVSTSSHMPLRLSKKLLNQARDRLLALQEKLEVDEDTKPIIIAENVSLGDYIKYRKTDRKLPVRIRLVDGKILAYEVPLTSHGAVVGRISKMVVVWNNQLDCAYEEDLIVGLNSYYTADLTIRPQGLPRAPAGQEPNSDGNAYPTMVVEVGNSEPVPSLHDLSAGYFSPRTTIQIYLAIKLFPIRQNGTRAMLALRYLRTNHNNTVPDIIISFGTASPHSSTIEFLTNVVGVPPANITGVGFSATACNTPGLPDYRLHIPVIELFNGASGGVPGAFNGLYLDLWELQNIVLTLTR
ncbi:6464_t:CDS:2 [Paraglomus brasilianum]|uniref:6464_t:CDS:1 n=1 Tax=Paraglomus brasilianum TaxID=144538 RepID=A0A9N8VSV1_9GLOM|nr:6464_t:CDS:2 [Paraglomus brasilianum]